MPVVTATRPALRLPLPLLPRAYPVGLRPGLPLSPAPVLAPLTPTLYLTRPGPRLTDRVPLRNTSVWGSTATPSTLPVAWGQVRLTPTPYDAQRRQFHLLDLPAADVRAVTVDDEAIHAWKWWNGPDPTGHGCAWLELADPLPAGATLAATLVGATHPRTGAALYNPADVVWDLLARVAGLAVHERDLDRFRAASSRAGLVIGGAVTDGSATLSEAISAILNSIGAVWSGAVDGLARLWPADPADDEPVSGPWGPLQLQGAAAALADDPLRGLRLWFDYDDAAGDHRQVLELTARSGVDTAATEIRELYAPWLRDRPVALAVATRLLIHHARWRWTISGDVSAADLGDLGPGEWVDLQIPRLPVSGPCLITAMDSDMATGDARVTLEGVTGPVPGVVTSA